MVVGIINFDTQYLFSPGSELGVRGGAVATTNSSSYPGPASAAAAAAAAGGNEFIFERPSAEGWLLGNKFARTRPGEEEKNQGDLH